MRVFLSILAALAVGVGASFVALRGGEHTWEVAKAIAPDNAHVAAVRGHRCEGGDV